MVEQLNFSGDVNGFGFKKEVVKKVDDWANRSNNELRKNDIPLRVVSSTNYVAFQFFTVLFFIGILTAMGFFVYYISEGKMQTSVNQSVNPQINVTSNSPVAISNQYTQPISNNLTIVMPSDMLTLCRQALNYSNCTI